MGLFIRINTISNRISIHKNTLEALDNPKYIQLGFNIQNKHMVIVPAVTKGKDRVRLYFTRDGACFVYSKAMIDGMRLLSGVLEGKGSYLLEGAKSDKEPAVCFDMVNAVMSS